MTNLIEREKREYLNLVDLVKKENQEQKRLKLQWSGMGLLASSPYIFRSVMTNFQNPITDFLTASLMFFMVYQAGTSGHPWIKKPYHLINPINMADNLITAIKIGLGDNQAASRFAERHKSKVAGTIDEKIYQTRIFSSDEEKIAELIIDLLETTPKIAHKPNMLIRTIEALTNLKRDSNEGYLERIIDAAYFERTNRPHLTEHHLRESIRKSKDPNETLTSLCINGIYFEARGQTEKATNFLRQAAKNVDSISKRFKEIKGSKNEIYFHDSTIIGGSIIFKTGENENEILEEHKKNEFIHQLMQPSKGLFVVPLALTYIDGRLYSITKRAGNFSLTDYIKNEMSEESVEIAKRGLGNILLLHLKTAHDSEDSKRIFGEETSRDLVKRIIGQSKGIINLNEKGLHFVADQLEYFVGLAHRDFHAGNIIANKKGDVCIIDLEKAKMGIPYIDPITLIDNYRTTGIFRNQEERERMFAEYCENLYDDGNIVDSLELAIRDLHLTGVLQNLVLFNRAAKIEGNTDDIREHHKRLCLEHLDTLEGFYSGITGINLKDLRTSLS